MLTTDNTPLKNTKCGEMSLFGNLDFPSGPQLTNFQGFISMGKANVIEYLVICV